MQLPSDRRYSGFHVWAKRDDRGDVRIGLTDVPGAFLGEAISVEIPAVHTDVSAGEPIGLIESSTTVLELFSPLAGTLVDVNPSVESVPANVTQDPFGGGWLATIRPFSKESYDALLTAEEYAKFLEEE